MKSVGQAAFGEREKGHALLGASPGSESIAARVVHSMDIQGTPPPGQQWPPYWSGFPAEGYYVLARTAPDPHASRAGMVRSRAVFLPLEALGSVPDLAATMRHLVADFGQPPPYADVEIDEDSGDFGVPYADLAAALLEGKLPVVWALDQDYVPALRNLWRHLWQAARGRLSFRFAFSPQDISSEPPDVVVTLPSLSSRWAGYRLVRPSGLVHDPAVALLTGNERGAHLAKLVSDLEQESLTIEGLKQAAAISEALSGPAELADTLNAIRLLAHLAPSSKQATQQKATLIKSGSIAMKSADLAGVRMARNLNLVEMPDREAFWNALTGWVAGKLLGQGPDAVVTILGDVGASADKSTEWQKAVRSGLRDAIRAPDKSACADIWRVLVKAPEQLEAVLSFAPERVRLARVLADAVPSLSGRADALLEECSRLGLVELHAAICAAAFSAKDAIRRHIEDMAATENSVRIALSHASDAELVEIAVTLDDQTALALAAHRAVSNPLLLKPLDITSSRWRRLWREAVAAQESMWSAVPNAVQAMARVLEGLLDGEFEDWPLLEVLSKTPLADQSGHERRAALWDRLPDPLRGRVLRASAHGWCARFIAEGPVDPPEDPLAQVILRDDCCLPLIEKLTEDPLRGSQLFQMFDSLSARRFRDYLQGMIFTHLRVSENTPRYATSH